jgi:hypothetical protein
MELSIQTISNEQWENAVLLLQNNPDTLWRMAWSCAAAYFAVRRLEALWQKERERLGLHASRYDRWAFDTIARSVRQAAFMYSETPLWKSMPKTSTADNKIYVQVRIGPKSAVSVVVWHANDPDTPWFVAIHGQVYLFPHTNGQRRALPGRAHTTHIQQALDTSLAPAAVAPIVTKKRATAAVGKTIKDVKASLARLPTPAALLFQQ